MAPGPRPLVTQKLMNRLKEGESAVEPPSPAAELLECKETPPQHGRVVSIACR